MRDRHISRSSTVDWACINTPHCRLGCEERMMSRLVKPSAFVSGYLDTGIDGRKYRTYFAINVSVSERQLCCLVLPYRTPIIRSTEASCLADELKCVGVMPEPCDAACC